MKADPTATAARILLALTAVVALAGCSISSTSSNVDHMRCVKAHDEWHDSGGTVTICDSYSPTP